MFVDNASLQGFLKIRGVFRLLRVFILLRKFSNLKERRDMTRRRMLLNSGYDLRSPLERVLEILNSLRDSIDVDEGKLINDLNYCIKVISSNSLYEAKLDMEGYDQKQGDEKGRTEVQMLLNTYSKATTSVVNPSIADKRRKSSVFFLSQA
jgi:hypothetical protein